MLTLRYASSCSRALAGLARNTNSFKNITATNQLSALTAAVNSHAKTASAALIPLHQHRWYATASSADKVDVDPKDLSGQSRVYYGSLAPRMKMVKVFSLTTSLVGLAAQPVLMEQGMKMGGTGMAVFICGFAGFFTFVTPILLHFITKKYVTEIHYNSATDEYTATTISIILQKIQTKFRPSDVKVPDVPGMFTSFLVGNRAMFVDPSLFEDPEHYVRIMGYDKPIDFKLDLTEKTQPEDKQQK